MSRSKEQNQKGNRSQRSRYSRESPPCLVSYFHKRSKPPNEKSSATGDLKPSSAKAELPAPTPVGCSVLLGHGIKDIINRLGKKLSCIIITIFLLQGAESFGQSILLGGDTIPHALKLGVKIWNPALVCGYGRSFITPVRSDVQDFKTPSLQESAESDSTGGNITAQQKPMAEIATSENHTNLRDLYDAVSPLIYMAAAAAGWWWCDKWREIRNRKKIRSHKSVAQWPILLMCALSPNA